MTVAGGRSKRVCDQRMASDGEAEIHDVAVVHHVLLALYAQLPLVACLGLAADCDEVLVVNDFRPDEPALEVAVDSAGGARCSVAAPDGPCLHLGLAHREKGNPV